MTVKIRKEQLIMGKIVKISQYEPSNMALTKDKREKADLLDEELINSCNQINNEYEELDNNIKRNELKKWKWLGHKLDKVIQNAKNIETTDVDNDFIWPAIGQHFRKELIRGYETRRSGTKKDHYRKCWLLATTDNLDWITSWSGWDAFIDRGEQIVISKKIMPILNKKFGKIKLKSRDYQRIAKTITNHLPSSGAKTIDIDSMKTEKIQQIVEDVYKEFIK